MNYKLIALDIDYTMLDSDGNLPERVRQSIHAAQAAGVEVMVATGRAYKATYPFMEKQLELPGVACIAFGGAQIWKGGRMIYSNHLNPEYTAELLQWGHDNGRHMQIFLWEDFISETDDDYGRDYTEMHGVKGITMPNVREFSRIESPKVLLLTEPEDIDQLQPMFVERYAGKLRVGRSRPKYLEFNGLDSNKGTALAEYAQMLGIDASQCIAIGDTQIDTPMLEWAGLGIAMDNAPDDVKAAANVIAPSCDEEGVAVMIEKYILGDNL